MVIYVVTAVGATVNKLLKNIIHQMICSYNWSSWSLTCTVGYIFLKVYLQAHYQMALFVYCGRIIENGPTYMKVGPEQPVC